MVSTAGSARVAWEIQPVRGEQPGPSDDEGVLLNELPGGRTRLVISGYQAMFPRWLGRLVFYWVFPTVVWFFQAGMLVVLKRNIERATTSAAGQATARRTF